MPSTIPQTADVSESRPTAAGFPLPIPDRPFRKRTAPLSGSDTSAASIKAADAWERESAFPLSAPSWKPTTWLMGWTAGMVGTFSGFPVKAPASRDRYLHKSRPASEIRPEWFPAVQSPDAHTNGGHEHWTLLLH